LRFLATIDPTQQMRRLDIIVYRVGEPSHVRLHPHKRPLVRDGVRTKEAKLVFGALASWLGETPSAQVTRNEVPQQDVVGRRTALQCLSKLAAGFTDLTDGSVFPWHRYLQSSPPLQGLVERGITRWAAVTDPRWHVDRVFLLCDRNGQLILVQPNTPGAREVFHEVPDRLVELAGQQGWIA